VISNLHGKDRMAPDERVTRNDASAQAPRHTPGVASPAAEVALGIDALPDSFGVPLSTLLQLAFDAHNARSPAARSEAALDRAVPTLTVGMQSGAEDRYAVLTQIASLVAESARLDASGPQQVVYSLRALWSRVPQPGTITPAEWDLAYHSILARCLKEFYAGA
jgi:hypothetical protein